LTSVTDDRQTDRETGDRQNCDGKYVTGKKREMHLTGQAKL